MGTGMSMFMTDIHYYDTNNQNEEKSFIKNSFYKAKQNGVPYDYDK